MSKWDPGHSQSVLTSEVSWIWVVSLAPIPQSELKRWHQCLVFRCLLCIQPNLGHVPAPPIISSLAAVRWQSQHGGVGAAARYFWACAAGEHGYKNPCHSPPSSRGSGTLGVERHEVQTRGGSLFSAQHSKSFRWLWADLSPKPSGTLACITSC